MSLCGVGNQLLDEPQLRIGQPFIARWAFIRPRQGGDLGRQLRLLHHLWGFSLFAPLVQIRQVLAGIDAQPKSVQRNRLDQAALDEVLMSNGVGARRGRFLWSSTG